MTYIISDGNASEKTIHNYYNLTVRIEEVA